MPKEQTLGSSSSSSNTGRLLPNHIFGSVSCKHWPKSSARGWMGTAGLSAEGLMRGFQADDMLRLVTEGLFVPSCMQRAGGLGWQDGGRGQQLPRAPEINNRCPSPGERSGDLMC